MEYNLIHNMIVNEFQQCISSYDSELRTTIFNNLYSWYMKNYADKIKQACLSNDENKLKMYAIQIENICNSPDVDKLKYTFDDPEYNKLVEISNEIFERIKNEKMITDDEYKNYSEKLESLKHKINKIHKNDCDYIISECMLDLEYLKRNGEYEYYSLRFDNYQSNKK